MGINILDKHTANLIAAGEVVERPASAIKEMLENSADACASRITVEIQNGGTTYFRVTDDGVGMSADDLPRSVLRHATSKISSAKDLAAIGTYGFRGEALAAIAAVCDLKILTKRRQDTFGSVLHICGGEILENGEAGCPDGTTIAASDIFKNIPARRKFLKKDSTEGAACLAVAEKFALSRPHIAVTFIADGNIKLKTSGDGNLKNAIYSCLGKEFAAKLIELNYTYEGIKISGYIGKPETARPSRSMQNFFINGRYVRSGTVCAALEEGFRAFCPTGKFPAAVIFCDLDFSRVDVNIHPAKTEVKFSEEKKVFEAVLFAVKTALNKGTTYTVPATPQYNTYSTKQMLSAFPPENAGDKTEPSKQINVETVTKPAYTQKPSFEEKKVTPPDFRNAFAEENTGRTDTAKVEEKLTVHSPSLSSASSNLDIFAPVKSTVFTDTPKKTEYGQQISFGFDNTVQDNVTEQTAKEEKTELITVIGECFDSFILVQKGEVLYIIDKHAAHERIIYEQIKNSVKTGESQILLEPEKIALSTEECAAINENKEYFSACGFEFDLFGSSSVLLRSYPTIISKSDISDIFVSLASKLISGNEKAAADIFDKALFSVACKAAVKAGQKNSIFTDEYITEKIFSSDAILYCPHGRPVICEFTKEKLYKMFKRT